jgi:hypothetical protein
LTNQKYWAAVTSNLLHSFLEVHNFVGYLQKFPKFHNHKQKRVSGGILKLSSLGQGNTEFGLSFLLCKYHWKWGQTSRTYNHVVSLLFQV